MSFYGVWVFPWSSVGVLSLHVIVVVGNSAVRQPYIDPPDRRKLQFSGGTKRRRHTSAAWQPVFKTVGRHLQRYETIARTQGLARREYCFRSAAIFVGGRCDPDVYYIFLRQRGRREAIFLKLRPRIRLGRYTVVKILNVKLQEAKLSLGQPTVLPQKQTNQQLAIVAPAVFEILQALRVLGSRV